MKKEYLKVINKEKQVAQFYKRKQIESASSSQLIILLYDGAIDFLNRAEAALAEKTYKRVELFYNNIAKCQNILSELMISLDLESGNKLAIDLYRLYEYMHYRLVRSSIHTGHTSLQEVKQLLLQLKEGWNSVAEQEAQQSRTPSPKSGLNLKG